MPTSAAERTTNDTSTSAPESPEQATPGITQGYLEALTEPTFGTGFAL